LLGRPTGGPGGGRFGAPGLAWKLTLASMFMPELRLDLNLRWRRDDPAVGWYLHDRIFGTQARACDTSMMSANICRYSRFSIRFRGFVGGS